MDWIWDGLDWDGMDLDLIEIEIIRGLLQSSKTGLIKH